MLTALCSNNSQCLAKIREITANHFLQTKPCQSNFGANIVRCLFTLPLNRQILSLQIDSCTVCPEPMISNDFHLVSLSIMINRKRLSNGRHCSELVGMPLKWSFNCRICQAPVDKDYSLSILIRRLLCGLRRI